MSIFKIFNRGSISADEQLAMMGFNLRYDDDEGIIYRRDSNVQYIEQIEITRRDNRMHTIKFYEIPTDHAIEVPFPVMILLLKKLEEKGWIE